jgi:simple sugar transport system ATP-binding protein
MFELRGVSRRHDAVLACDAVDLSVDAGEIHGVLGENGAGKSTLVHIIAGLIRPDAGALLLAGTRLRIATPCDARACGIGAVFQQPALFSGLTLAESLAVALGGGVAVTEAARRLAATASRFGVALEPGRKVGAMTPGERQIAEILRCVMQAADGLPRLLVLDEPAASLTPPERRALFGVIRAVASLGCGVLYVAHRIEEVTALCTRVTVLRGGRVVGVCDARETGPGALAEMMTGQAAKATRRAHHRPGAPVLQLRGLSLAPARGTGVRLHDIGLDLRSGEIVGIAGATGHGQAELVAAISGEVLARRPGEVLLEGMPVGRSGVAQRRRAGLRHVPAGPLGRAAVGAMSLSENALLTCWDMGLIRRGSIRRDRLERLTRSILDLMRIPASDTAACAARLSSADLQRFVLGRELGFAPRVLVAEQPTGGLDVRAAQDIRQALLDLAAAGVAVLLVSGDLDELLAVCDRVAVMSEGRLSPPVLVVAASAAALADAA